MQNDYTQHRVATQVEAIDWKRWTPVDRGTLLFVIRNRRILLIHKKRGLGAGNLNGPGGRLEPNESPVTGAVREVREELCIDVIDPTLIGELQFQFLDGYSIHVFVFLADEYAGVPTETVEAIPLWTPIDRIPYESMWEDDRYWFPLLLDRQPFSGRFIFDGDKMLDYQLQDTRNWSDWPVNPGG
ncbi:MAG: 8-oxo-dGTP diphosphatase [Acidobacteriota bacterium]